MGSGEEEAHSRLGGVGPWLIVSANVHHVRGRAAWWDPLPQSHVLVTKLGLNWESGPGSATPCGDA